jgi:hypothetical protein
MHAAAIHMPRLNIIGHLPRPEADNNQEKITSDDTDSGRHLLAADRQVHGTALRLRQNCRQIFHGYQVLWNM